MGERARMTRRDTRNESEEVRERNERRGRTIDTERGNEIQREISNTSARANEIKKQDIPR